MAAITNAQILGLIAILEIAIEIIEAEQVVATIAGEAEFVLTAVESGEDTIFISAQMQSGTATIFQGTTANILAEYDIAGMTGGISDNIVIGEETGISNEITWNQMIPTTNDLQMSFSGLWTGNAIVGTDSSFILAEASLENFDAVLLGEGAENYEASVSSWYIDLVTQFEEVGSEGGGSP